MIWQIYRALWERKPKTYSYFVAYAFETSSAKGLGSCAYHTKKPWDENTAEEFVTRLKSDDEDLGKSANWIVVTFFRELEPSP